MSAGRYLPLIPFFAFLGIFLLVPTITVISGAFQDGDAGGFTMGNIQALTSDAALTALRKSLLLSGSSALSGGLLGALLSYLIVSMGPGSFIRRTTLSICGVLAQFGGVTLAFAWISLLGFSGLVTESLRSAGINIYGSGWFFGLNGLIIVYTYFQVPLMVIVFTPAMEGLRPHLREAAVNLGATVPQYWRLVGIPLLIPAFLGSVLLLFANAFAAYATAVIIVSQGNPIVPLLIRSALTSEVLLGQKNLGFALATEMIVVVAIVMGLYAVLVRRTSRWLQ